MAKKTAEKANKKAAKSAPLITDVKIEKPTCPKCKTTIETVCVAGAGCPKCGTRLA